VSQRECKIADAEGAAPLKIEKFAVHCCFFLNDTGQNSAKVCGVLLEISGKSAEWRLYIANVVASYF